MYIVYSWSGTLYTIGTLLELTKSVGLFRHSRWSLRCGCFPGGSDMAQQTGNGIDIQKGGDARGGGQDRSTSAGIQGDFIANSNKCLKEGNVKRSLILLLILPLVMPVLFLGCSGDDGSTGAAGISTLAAVTNEPAGANCANGGQKLTSGVGDKGNGIPRP